jgi:dimeric dUTPase (all-alpha-NTP-PPase superfamily)
VSLAKLFETQKILRDRIDYSGSDRFEKLVLALLVEVGECANEWRGFKFWSKDQKPRTHKVRHPYMDLEDAEFYNPLLEEYVDGKHFLIDLGIELGLGAELIEEYVGNQKKRIGTMENHFGYLYNRISELMDIGSLQDKQFKLIQIFNAYIGLGYRLGFTWDEIEQAYYAKNQINHQRQEDGY